VNVQNVTFSCRPLRVLIFLRLVDLLSGTGMELWLPLGQWKDSAMTSTVLSNIKLIHYINRRQPSD
uniref:Uncharacterized protein n=1 Tax=Triticum urartu TaxID=4572 RepID=A0A8R7P8H1_TRIUA